MDFGRKSAICIAWLSVLFIQSIACQSEQQMGITRKITKTRVAAIDCPAEMRLGGQRGAAIKIEVFSDFQCVRCRDFYIKTLKPILSEYTVTGKIDKIYMVYHDFPLDLHLYARKASLFSLAAASLGRDRWLQVIDSLYLEQEKWSKDGNIEAALGSKLNPAAISLIASLAGSAEMEGALLDEIRFGYSRNISSTPTFYVIQEKGYEERIIGSVSYKVMKRFIDSLVK